MQHFNPECRVCKSGDRDSSDGLFLPFSPRDERERSDGLFLPFSPRGDRESSDGLFLPGYYCPVGTANYTDYACPTGHYCPLGTHWWNQFPCDAGTHNNLTHRTKVDDCLSCPGNTLSLCCNNLADFIFYHPSLIALSCLEV